jgi:hypothetical protein
MTFYQQLCKETERERQELLTVRTIQDGLHGRLTLSQYRAFLTQAYHHVKHTVPLLMACGSRLPERLAWLRGAVAEYITEEIGHEQWILADLAACPESAAEPLGNPSLETELMVAYAYHQIDRNNPAGFFGMVHVLEGTSIAVATQAAEAVRTSLNLPPQAFTYLTSHGSLDLQHVKLFEGLMNKLDHADDQAAVIGTARAMYRLYGNIFRALPQQQAFANAEAA